MLILNDCMADVKPILLNYYLDRCYCQEMWQILLSKLWADVVALVCEMVIPQFMADVKPILLNYYLGRCYYQELWQILMPTL